MKEGGESHECCMNEVDGFRQCISLGLALLSATLLASQPSALCLAVQRSTNTLFVSARHPLSGTHSPVAVSASRIQESLVSESGLFPTVLL